MPQNADAFDGTAPVKPIHTVLNEQPCGFSNAHISQSADVQSVVVEKRCLGLWLGGHCRAALSPRGRYPTLRCLRLDLC